MSAVVKTIVAMGGGGFSMEPDNPRLDRYVLGLTGKARPRVCFVPTASGDAAEYLLRFHEAFQRYPCEHRHLRLFNRTVIDIPTFLRDQDVIYVGGGNTVNMLAAWRAHGVDIALREAWESGVVLCGLSAGSLCWYESGVTDSFGRALEPWTEGLGFLPGSHCPHYDGELTRRPAYQQLVSDGTLASGMAADDGVALRYDDQALVEIVSSRPAARAFRVSRGPEGIVEQALEPRLLDE